MLEVLGAFPGSTFGFRGGLDIATSHIEPYALAKNPIRPHGNEMQFGGNYKIELGRKHPKTNSVQLGKMASGLWGP